MEDSDNYGVHGNIKQEVVDEEFRDEEFRDEFPGPAREMPGSLQGNVEAKYAPPTTNYDPPTMTTSSSDIPESSGFQIVHNSDYGVEAAYAEQNCVEREYSEDARDLNHFSSITSADTVTVIKRERTDDEYELSYNIPSRTREHSDDFTIEINHVRVDERNEKDDIHEEYPIDESDMSKNDDGSTAQSMVNFSNDGEVASSSGICVKEENVDCSYDISYACSSRNSEDHFQDAPQMLFKEESIDVPSSGIDGVSESAHAESEMRCKDKETYSDTNVHNDLDDDGHRRRSTRVRLRRLDYNEFDSDSGDEDITVTLEKSTVDQTKSKFEVYLDRDSVTDHSTEIDPNDIDTGNVEGSDGTNNPLSRGDDSVHHIDTMVEQYAIYNPERSEMVGIKSINPKQCFVCKKTFQYEFHKMYHMQQIHPEYLIKDRRQTLKTRKQDAKLGVNSLRGRYSKRCFICRNKAYSHPYYLNIHMQKMHAKWLISSTMIKNMAIVRPDGTEPTTPFDFNNKKVCPVCQESFVHAFQLKYHIQKDHAEILVQEAKIGEMDSNSDIPTSSDTTAMFRKEVVKPTVSANGTGGIKLTYTITDLISIKKQMDKEKFDKEAMEAQRQAFINNIMEERRTIPRRKKHRIKFPEDDLDSVKSCKRKSHEVCEDDAFSELPQSELGDSPDKMSLEGPYNENEGQSERPMKRKRGRPKKKILDADRPPAIKKPRGRPRKNANLPPSESPTTMKSNKISDLSAATPEVPDFEGCSGPTSDTPVNLDIKDVIKTEPNIPCNEDNPMMDMDSPTGTQSSIPTKNVEATIQAAGDTPEEKASEADDKHLLEEEYNTLDDSVESSALPSVNLNVGGDILEYNKRLEVKLSIEAEPSSYDSVQNHDILNEQDEECSDTELERTPIDMDTKEVTKGISHDDTETPESPLASTSRPKRLRKKKEMTDMVPTPGWPTKLEKKIQIRKLKTLTDNSMCPPTLKNTIDGNRTTLDPKSVYCGQCGKLFINHVLFKKHESVCKSSQMEPVSPKGYYPCKQCGKVFTHVAAHQLHILRDHLDIRHSCPFCGKLFAYQSIMKKHMVIHANEAVKKAISALPESSSSHEDASLDPDADLVDRIAKLPEIQGLKFHKGGVEISMPFENRKMSLDTAKVLPDVLSSNDQFASDSDDEDVSVAEVVVGNPSADNSGKPSFSVLKQQLMSPGMKSTVISTQAMCPKPSAYGPMPKNAFVRSPGKSYSCKTCEESFTTIPLLYMHELHRHPKHTCPYCSKMFAYDGLLKKHLVVHMDEEKFVCIWCGKAYFFLTNFTSHMMQHNGNDSNHRLSCNKCGMEWFDNEGRLSIAIKDDIAEHLRQCMSEDLEVDDMLKTCLTHGHKNKSQRCLKCQKCYILNAEHSRNVKISHVLRCKMCNQTFPDVKGLKKDLQRHHSAAEDIVPNYRADRSFNCGSCSEKFNCLFEFMCHMSAHKRTFHVKTEVIDEET